MPPRRLFSSKEDCESRAKAPTRQELYAQEDMMDDAHKIEARIAFELGNSGYAPRRRASTSPASRSAKRLQFLEAERVMLENIAKGYRSLDLSQGVHCTKDAVLRTFRYLFYRHKRGVFISIRDGRVRTFMAFINRHFINPLAGELRLAPEAHQAVQQRLREQAHAYTVAGEVSAPVFNPPASWGNIGCLVGNVIKKAAPAQADGYEVDYNHVEVRFFLERVCEARHVPDCNFFVNYYDQVVLREDLSVPFWHIVEPPAGRKIPAGKRAPMCPIVSMCHRPGYLDLPCVFPDDVRRVWRGFAPPSCSNPYLDEAQYETRWEAKMPTAVFRGTATGCGWTVETNPRLQLAHMSSQQGNTTPPLLDVVLTGTDNVRFKKHRSDRYVRYYRDTRVLQDSSRALTMAEQSRFKYVLYVEGNVAAYRLSGLFGLGSLVILVKGDYHVWFQPHLRHMHNCFIVPSAADVPAAVRWCRTHDTECRRMAAEGLRLFKMLFGQQGLLDYGRLLLEAVAAAGGGVHASTSVGVGRPGSRLQNFRRYT